MNGYLGKLLTVDLTTGRIGEEAIPESDLRDFVGGASLGARLLYRQLTPLLDPLGPDNPLLFITGPLTGSAAPRRSPPRRVGLRRRAGDVIR